MKIIQRASSTSISPVRQRKADAEIPACEICILAGGLSARMGRDKARLRLGGRTLLAHIREAASQCAVPVRIIRQDLVPRCGPLGGIYTGLKTTRALSVVFLSCDMPFLSAATIQQVIDHLVKRTPAVFFETSRIVGFPFGLKANTLLVVEAQLQAQTYSLQALARNLKTKRLRSASNNAGEFFNINDPSDYELAQRHPLTP